MNVFPSSLLQVKADAPVLGVRPEHLRIAEPNEGLVRGRVSTVELLGDVAIVHVEVDGHSFAGKVLRETAPAPASEVGISFEDSQLHEFESIDGPAR